MGPYRFCSGGTLDKPSSGYRFGYRFRVGPYRFCSDGNPTTLSILLWSYLILSDTHINIHGVKYRNSWIIVRYTESDLTIYIYIIYMQHESFAGPKKYEEHLRNPSYFSWSHHHLLSVVAGPNTESLTMAISSSLAKYTP